MIHDSAVREGERPVTEIVAGLRWSVGSRRLAPTTSPREPFLDLLVHGQDIAPRSAGRARCPCRRPRRRRRRMDQALSAPPRGGLWGAERAGETWTGVTTPGGIFRLSSGPLTPSRHMSDEVERHNGLVGAADGAVTVMTGSASGRARPVPPDAGPPCVSGRATWDRCCMRNVITGDDGPWSWAASVDGAEGRSRGTALHPRTVSRAFGDAICRALDAAGRCP
ncbi:hypothetical protein ACIP4U_37105 [Streptomyces caelestis]|jgi:hypothetical protein|uniref:Uncharacterized protein n=1 Tax=Streptomyces caelestis TaxID=36816 RepID=A0A7W9LQH6_9ACTN|nr:hypothetical protein [Streptomyces caelestis]MBB5792267.1 hypothetical protein [Streptomyces caelestis]GGW78364.1 hypothetical protein GCM10010320_70660 [Streptomyces caelestis]